MKRALNPGAVVGLCLLAGCGEGAAPGAFTDTKTNAVLVQGPPMQDIVTEFDKALSCMKGKLPGRLNFGVGVIADNTGKEQYADSGSGKFMTQGAGDIVQSALFRAGVTVVNRRDPNIVLAENNWGIRNIKTQDPVDFYVTGSITSLDFIPGGGYTLGIAGVGPRERQNRILAGLDLAMTDAATGRVVANVPLQKQIYEKEVGFSSSRFFDSTLVEADLGGIEREALQAALRQMLTYATFELLAQLPDPAAVTPCRALIGTADAAEPGAARPHAKGALDAALKTHDLYASTAASAPEGAAAPQPGAPQGLAPQAPASPKDTRPNTPEVLKLVSEVTVYASRSIAASEAAGKAGTMEARIKSVDEAGLNLVLAVKSLKAAAAAGLHGPEGDAAALLVEQAMRLEASARKALEDAGGKAAASTPDPSAPAAPAAPAPVPTPNAPKQGGSGDPIP